MRQTTNATAHEREPHENDSSVLFASSLAAFSLLTLLTLQMSLIAIIAFLGLAALQWHDSAAFPTLIDQMCTSWRFVTPGTEEI